MLSSNFQDMPNTFVKMERFLELVFSIFSFHCNYSFIHEEAIIIIIFLK